MDEPKNEQPKHQPPQARMVDEQKLIQFLSAKWKGRACPMCNAGPWNASPELFEIRQFFDGNIVLGPGKLVPLIAVTCSNCGNTVLINALITKLMEAGEAQ